MVVFSRTSMTTGSQAFFSAAAARRRRASCRGVKPRGLLEGVVARGLRGRAGFNSLSVQVMGPDVLLHPGGHLAPYRPAGGDVASYLAGRDGRRVLQAERDPGAAQPGGPQVGLPWRVHARPPHDYDRGQ